VVATTDPATLPTLTTWYLETNLPAPDPAPTTEQELPAADVAEVVRLYSLRMWIEQSYKQIKHTLGWAQYQVRTDLAMRRHWALVYCAFSFCWWHVRDPMPPDGVLYEDDVAAVPSEAAASDTAAGQKKVVASTTVAGHE
jgi:hypothetical protein